MYSVVSGGRGKGEGGKWIGFYREGVVKLVGEEVKEV
jgi:hypothetical protein